MSTPLPSIVDGLPRRCRVDLAMPAESSIRAAMAAVEEAGASLALTDAVVLLDKALNRVADHFEGKGNTQKNRPICPECGKPTIVLFTPPKEGLIGTAKGYATIGTPDFIDWDRAGLYCCNGATNCKYEARLRGPDLTTP